MIHRIINTGPIRTDRGRATSFFFHPALLTSVEVTAAGREGDTTRIAALTNNPNPFIIDRCPLIHATKNTHTKIRYPRSDR